MKTKTFLMAMVLGLSVPLMLLAESTFVQTTIGSGCSSVCINNQCTSSCSSEPVVSDETGKRVIKEIDFKDFDRIVVNGVDIEVFESEDYLIRFDAFENFIDAMTITKSQTTLTITPEQTVVSNSDANLQIGMPELKSLRRSGTGTVTIDGFEQSSLELELSGTGKLKAQNNVLERLTLKTSGTVNVDMQASEVKEAEVLAEGVNQIALKFSDTQSALSGEITGVSTLLFCGEPVNSLSVQGISKTKKIQCL